MERKDKMKCKDYINELKKILLTMTLDMFLRFIWAFLPRLRESGFPFQFLVSRFGRLPAGFPLQSLMLFSVEFHMAFPQ